MTWVSRGRTNRLGFCTFLLTIAALGGSAATLCGLLRFCFPVHCPTDYLSLHFGPSSYWRGGSNRCTYMDVTWKLVLFHLLCCLSRRPKECSSVLILSYFFFDFGCWAEGGGGWASYGGGLPPLCACTVAPLQLCFHHWVYVHVCGSWECLTCAWGDSFCHAQPPLAHPPSW